MSYLVSPCCGAEYTDYDGDISECCGATIIHGICSDRDCREHAEPEEGYICEKCDEFFTEPEEEFEVLARLKENYEEMMNDERRDLGL